MVELSAGPWALSECHASLDPNRWMILAPDPRGGIRCLMAITHNGEELPEKQRANLRAAVAGPALLSALRLFLEVTPEPPERNCSCRHTNPPCPDCEEHSALREAFELGRAAVAQAEGRS